MSVAEAPSARKMSEKPSDEEQRVDEGVAPRAVDVVERHPRDEGDVARDERKHAGREKARESRAERDAPTPTVPANESPKRKRAVQSEASVRYRVVFRSQISRLSPRAATVRRTARVW